MDEPYHASILKRDISLFDVEDVYRLRPDRKWPWMQRVLFWVLRKLGALDQRWKPTFSQVDINLNHFGRFLQQFGGEVYRRTGEAPRRVLVGWQTMDRFICSGEWKDLMCSPQRIDLPYGNRYAPYERGQYRGFSILTLPWFKEGVIFLPNDL